MYFYIGWTTSKSNRIKKIFKTYEEAEESYLKMELKFQKETAVFNSEKVRLFFRTPTGVLLRTRNF